MLEQFRSMTEEQIAEQSMREEARRDTLDDLVDATGCTDEDAHRALEEADGDYDVALTDLEADQYAMLKGLYEDDFEG